MLIFWGTQKFRFQKSQAKHRTQKLCFFLEISQDAGNRFKNLLNKPNNTHTFRNLDPGKCSDDNSGVEYGVVFRIHFHVICVALRSVRSYQQYLGHD